MKRITVEMTREEIANLNKGHVKKVNVDGLTLYLCGTMFADHVKEFNRGKYDILIGINYKDVEFMLNQGTLITYKGSLEIFIKEDKKQ